MFALIETGGKQYRVTEGTILKVEKLDAEEGSMTVLDKILLLTDNDGIASIGRPFVEGATVVAKVIEQGRRKKVVVYKYKKRKNYHKKQGHRQAYTKLVIENIYSAGEYYELAKEEVESTTENNDLVIEKADVTEEAEEVIDAVEEEKNSEIDGLIEKTETAEEKNND